jgi:hypothetical protein
VGLFCLLLVIYVAGYYALARHPTIAVPSFEGEPVEHVREYPLSIIRRAYAPIAWIDAQVVGASCVGRCAARMVSYVA